MAVQNCMQMFTLLGQTSIQMGFVPILSVSVSVSMLGSVNMYYIVIHSKRIIHKVIFYLHFLQARRTSPSF